MRLGQLSRKINTKPTEILSYLKNEFDVELGSHLNTKVDDELAEKVIEKFSTKPVAKVIPTETVKPVPPKETNTEPEEVFPKQMEESSAISATEEIINELPKAPQPIKEYEVNQEVDAATIKNAELIKAPKVALDGPKVVGKIELPPSLEEQMVEIDGVMISKAELANRKREERKERREKSQGSKRRTSSKIKSKSAKSEAQVAQIKKDKEAELMAVRLAHREKRITKKKKEKAQPKSKFVAKPVKKRPVTKKMEEQQNVISKPKPTTWYGKLWLWFNT
tara:strand:- start:53411 stop:54247 length:837 start_codon:yes stop_codon:yes gene_type:complete